MTSAPAPASPAFRRAVRDIDQPVVGGVASGLARHLGVPVLWVRVAFLVSAALGGLGVAFYAGLWLMLPGGSQFEPDAPGLESARRSGRRPGRIRSLSDVGPIVVLTVLGLGAVFAVDAVFGRGTILWPVVIALVGVALLWRQADEAQRERWLDATGRVDPLRVVLGDGSWASYARLAAGLGLIVLALVLASLRAGSLSSARDVIFAALLGVSGLAIVVGPWVFRLAAELTAERTERVRTQERADVAAHLHDSVLQTLALIQRSAGDSVTVARLARAQERDLRSWLYAGESTDESSVASALRGVAAATEDTYGVAVDVVTVGDCDFDEVLRPVVAATREALTNAATHAGVARVDLYAEITDAAIEVFVRDRGRGFDPSATPADRLGIRNSIEDRMRRHGGSGEVRSTVGEGSEVRLRLPRSGRDARGPRETRETRDDEGER